MKRTRSHSKVILLVTAAGLLRVAIAAEPLVNHQAADLVLGQQSFTTSGSGAINASTMNLPTGVAVSPVTGKVFVAELNRHRILRFSTAASMQSGSSAEAVFGQPTMFVGSPNGGGATVADSLNWPRQIFVDAEDRLWVADQMNHRVLYFENASSAITTAAADGVLGQTNFTNNTSATLQARMSNPNGVCVDSAGRLWVADSGNNRILRFDNPTSGNGGPASAVLGQPNFTSSAAGTSSTTMDFPNRVATGPGGILWVSDLSNHRVLRFDDAALKLDGDPANAVLGQADFAGGAENQGVAASAQTLSGPSGLAVNSRGTLFVGDVNNHRVLWFENAASKATHAPADGVLGQPNFTAAGFATAGPQSIAGPSSLWFDTAGRIWLSDGSFHRVVRFSPDTTAPTLTIKGKGKRTTSKSRQAIKGTASDTHGIREVRFRPGKHSYRKASGTENWKFSARLRRGPNRIRVQAMDAVGNLSKVQTARIRRR